MLWYENNIHVEMCVVSWHACVLRYFLINKFFSPKLHNIIIRIYASEGVMYH